MKRRKKSPVDVVDDIMDAAKANTTAYACNFCAWAAANKAGVRALMIDHLLGEHPGRYIKES